MANNEHRTQVIGPRASDPIEVSCSWAEDQGASNVWEGTHHCPFCGQVVEPVVTDEMMEDIRANHPAPLDNWRYLESSGSGF
jgi:hypothetical protein